MPVFQVEESDKYPVFPDGTEVNVEVVGVKQQELSFQFRIIDPEYAHLDDRLWGSVSPPAPKVGNRCYLWLCALFGTDELTVGMSIDTSDLVGQQATAELTRYESKSGKVGNNVKALYALSSGPSSVVRPDQGSATPTAPQPFEVQANDFEDPF